MKKLFTLSVCVLASCSLFASAEFFLRIRTNGNFTVRLNNETQNSTSNIFRFFDLHPGSYQLTIINTFSGMPVLSKKISLAESIRTAAEYDRTYGLKIADRLPFAQSFWYLDYIAASAPDCAPVQQAPNYPGTHYPGYPSNPAYPNPGGYGYGHQIDDASLQSLMETMKHVSFEEKMIEVAKTALKNKTIRTSQIHRLLSLFSFEQNKLELAKYCYDKTIDKNTYYTLYNDFTFSSYSAELDTYINSH
jgi:hypothetical protein